MAAADDIWKRLADCGLVTGAQAASIRTEFEHEPGRKSEDPDPSGAVLRWLASHNRISEYQRHVLASGRAGPFQFEDYLVHGCIDSGPLAGTFRARHLASGHPVRLFFFGGKSIDDAQAWRDAQDLSRQWQPIVSPLVWRIFENVTFGQYRFVVTTAGTGKTMLEKFPRKGRVPWPQACQALEQLAHGLLAIDQQGMVHGKLSPAFVWIQKSGVCQIIPPLPQVKWTDSVAESNGNGKTDADDNKRSDDPRKFLAPGRRRSPEQPLDVRDDLFALGQIGLRLMAGRVKTMRKTEYQERLTELEVLKPAFKKYDLPEPLQALVTGLLTADVSNQPPSISTVVGMLKNILGSQSTLEDVDPALPTLPAYGEVIEQRKRSSQFFEELETRAEIFDGATQSTHGQTESPDHRMAFDFDSLESGTTSISASQRVTRRRNSSSRSSLVPWIAGSAVVLIAVTASVLLSGFGQKDPHARTADADKADAVSVDVASDANPDANHETDPVASPNGDPDSPAGDLPEATGPTTASSGWLEQSIEDGADLAWESPTAGPPIDATWLPPAPEFIFAWSPARVVQNPKSQAVLRSIGPQLGPWLDRWQEHTGIPLEQIRRMTVSLHSASGRYELFVSAELLVPADQQTLLAGMPDMESVAEPAAGTKLYERDSVQICLVAADDDQNLTSRILLGTGQTIGDMFERGGLASCERHLGQLINRSDQDRDLTLLLLNSALLSDEGAWLFADGAAALRRPLQLFFDDRVRAVLMSAHLDHGTYLELMTAQTIDLPDDEATEQLRGRFEQVHDDLVATISARPAHSYWQSVQQRVASMLDTVAENVRVANEADGVIANCWLPESALHNLVAVAELSLADTRFNRAADSSAASGPQSLTELLATPRTLELANSPDLRVLLEDLQTEIGNDFPDLPFPFIIRLQGDDLQKDGITQNQRPGDIAVQQKPLAEILTTIMFQANPDKDATGPNDSRCKLVWVVAADPGQADRQIVLVTTRAAAQAKNLELPEAFRVD